MYFLITSAVTLSPTVRAKYPSSQNSPPHSCLRTSGNSSRISFALTALNSPTTSPIAYFGGKLKNMMLGNLLKQLLHPLPNRPLQHPLAILRRPHQMIPRVVHTVAGSLDRHATTVADWCCLWQHAFFIPALPGVAFKCNLS